MVTLNDQLSAVDPKTAVEMNSMETFAESLLLWFPSQLVHDKFEHLHLLYSSQLSRKCYYIFFCTSHFLM